MAKFVRLVHMILVFTLATDSDNETSIIKYDSNVDYEILYMTRHSKNKGLECTIILT